MKKFGRSAALTSICLVACSGSVLRAQEEADPLARQLGARALLMSYAETPSLSTPGRGAAQFVFDPQARQIKFRLRYQNLRGTAIMAHIHLGQRGTAGGIIAFLCGGGSGPACPNSGTVDGVITAADVVGPTGQGVQAGDLAAVLRAIRAGAVYANVHSDLYPDGEIRGQLRPARNRRAGGEEGEDNRDDNE